MRKLSAKKKVKKTKSQDDDAASLPDSNVNLEANENGGKSDESSCHESENSKTKKRKNNKKNANDKVAEKEDNGTDPEDEKTEEDDVDDAPAKKDGGDADESAEEEYEVQEIVDEKVEKGITYYLIRWKGYGPEGDTWEPEDTLSCPDIVAKFVKKKSKESTSHKKSKKAVSAPRGKKRKAAKDDDDDDDNEQADPEKEWEVERIIDVGYEKGVRLFRVRWKGYRPKFDTWEPEENLNCGDLVEKFLEKIKKTEGVDQKDLREQPKRTQRLTGDSYRRGSKRNAGKTRVVYTEEAE